MKVFARLFQKAAGSWGRAPGRLRRGETLLNGISLVLSLCLLAQRKNGENLFNVKNERAVGVECEKIVSVLFDTTGAKRTKNAESFARCDERRGLRALDLRKLLKKFDQNFCEKRCAKLL